MAFTSFGKSSANAPPDNVERRKSVRRKGQRRSAERFQIPGSTPVRFFVGDVEVEGALVDVSVSGMRIAAPFIPDIGVNIRLYIDQLGRIDGYVVRQTENGFSIKASISENETLRIREWLNKKTKDGADERRTFGRRADDHPVMRLKDVTCARLDGSQFPCQLVNLSAQGVEIKTEFELDIGERIILNGTPGTVKSKTEGGYKIARCSD